MALNLDAFHRLQKETEQAGTQITPWQWQKLGGDPAKYSQLYGPTAWYKADGSTTPAAPAGTQNAPWDDPRYRDPNTGYPVQPITGVHVNPQTGEYVAPGGGYSTPEEAVATAERFMRQNMEFQQGLNRFDEQTAYGSQRWERQPDGSLRRVVEQGPWEQRKYEQQAQQDYNYGTEIDKRVGQIGNQRAYNLDNRFTKNTPQQTGLNLRGLNDFTNRSYKNVPQALNMEELTPERKRIEDQLYNDYLRRNESRFGTEQKNLQQQIADMGIDPLSQKGKDLALQLSRQQEDARMGAQTEAVRMGGEELSRSYGIGADIRERGTREIGEQYAMSADQRERMLNEQIQKFSAGNTARQNAIAEYEKTRYAPWQEAQMARGMQTGVREPNLTAPGQINVPWLDPAAVGSTYRGQDTSKTIEQMRGEAARDVANISGEWGYKAALAKAEEDAIDGNIDFEDPGAEEKMVYRAAVMPNSYSSQPQGRTGQVSPPQQMPAKAGYGTNQQQGYGYGYGSSPYGYGGWY